MASVVAEACISTSTQMPAMTVQEKVSRNKRKFRADPPLADPNKIIPLPQNECNSFEISCEKFDVIPNHAHINGCDMCCGNQDGPNALKLEIGLSCSVGPSKIDAHDADWSDLTESQLEELVLSNLDTIFTSAIKKITAGGYSEKIANKAILRSGLWYGCKDMVSNIVDNTLAFLRSGQEIDRSREHYFDDLQQMKKYILAELVCLLREVRPFFSTGDAMWCLLVCDMNVSHACAIDGEPSGSSFLADSAKPQLKKTESCENNIANGPNLSPETSFVLNGDKECPENSISNINEKPFSAKGISSSRKVSGISKREYILRQKSIHLERHYRSKGITSRSGKLSSFSGLVLDKKLKAVADSTGVNSMDSSIKPDHYNNQESRISSLSLPVSDTELSLSFPAKNQWVPRDRKDEMIVKLVPRVKELQNQLQEWTEWANEKVMQAARRLGKDKAELKTLKQEKEEVERLEKEKRVLEESTLKKLSEMENALRKAGGQVERANFAVRRLEFEKGALRREMEFARVQAAESAASCREVARREKKNLAKFQSWEKQKGFFQEELVAEKRKCLQLQQEVEKASDVRDQAQARWNNEAKSKDDLLTQVTSLKKEREQIEASAKSKEETIKSRAESNLHKHKNDIERLEKEISQLRFKTDSSKIAALRNTVNNNPALKNHDISHMSRMVGSTDLVKRDRECVMCLSEEMSVVFLPCAHQVVCVMCNDLHEKQGMKECPSCRGAIQRRVCVRYARS